jgi:TolA-binding protein
MDKALQYFTSLIDKYPQSEIVPDAYYAIGLIHLAGSKLDDAVDYFNKVVELGPSDLAAQAAIAIADIRTRTGDPDDAVAAYQQKLKEYPHLGHLIYPKIADILYKQGRNEDALRLYMKSLELVPQRQMPEIQFRIAEILQAQGKIPEAVEAYLRVSYLFPGNKSVEVSALLRAARIYEDQDNIREAVAMYEKIVKMDTKEAAFARERIESLKGADK